MKNIWKLFGGLVLLVGAVSFIHAACNRTDMACWPVGPLTNETVEAQIDAGGNLNLNGVVTAAGTGTNTVSGSLTTTLKTVYVPASVVTVSTLVPIAITSTYEQIISTGAMLIFSPSSVVPAITTATATAGQYLILSSTSSASDVLIATGTATAVIGSDQFILISSTKSAASFIYNSTLSQWMEIGKQL